MPETTARVEKRRDRQITFIVAGVLACLLLTAATAVGAAVYKYQSGGGVRSVKTATTMGGAYQTKLTTFTAVPGAQTQVTIPNGERAILIITFSAESACTNGVCHMTAYVDNAQASPGDIYFDADSVTGRYQARSFQWVSAVLAPGTHTVTMAARVEASANFILGQRTLTVLRVKA